MFRSESHGRREEEAPDVFHIPWARAERNHAHLFLQTNDMMVLPQGWARGRREWSTTRHIRTRGVHSGSHVGGLVGRWCSLYVNKLLPNWPSTAGHRTSGKIEEERNWKAAVASSSWLSNWPLFVHPTFWQSALVPRGLHLTRTGWWWRTGRGWMVYLYAPLVAGRVGDGRHTIIGGNCKLIVSLSTEYH